MQRRSTRYISPVRRRHTPRNNRRPRLVGRRICGRISSPSTALTAYALEPTPSSSPLDATKAASAKRIAVVAADNRLAQPRSSFERTFGDGAATLVVGDDQIIASIDGHLSFSHEIMDTWRPANEDMVRSWEDRFWLEKGFIESLRESASKALQKFGTTTKEYAKGIFSAPDARAHREATRALGLEAAQVQD